MSKLSTTYTALCYHYLRPDKDDTFPRLLGHSESELTRHVELLKQHFYILSPKEVRAFHLEQQAWPSNKPGVLFTFDDGLSDHIRAAKILADHSVSAIFFVPTCPFLDKQPANPIIVHYALAMFGIEKFLEFYHRGLDQLSENSSMYHITYQRRTDDPWAVIGKIKHTLKYNVSPKLARQILLYVYEHLIDAGFQDMLNQMHLDVNGLKKIQSLGHTIGAHSRTHVSVAAGCTTPDDLNTEFIEPGQYLTKITGGTINVFSFPFGEPQDCLSPSMMSSISACYELAFTVEPVANQQNTDKLAIGRYLPMSTDSEQDILRKLNAMLDTDQFS